ncbi:MAG TPA: hypothetical protein VK277_12455 [Acidimicrobiales bacterium]|nr:hypothetical protein [Acidimicrobiales bacterium]
MIRKICVIAAAVAIPLGIVVATSGVASAGGSPPVNVTGSTVSCSTVTGTLKFSPPLTGTGTSPETVSIAIKYSGCTTNAPGVSLAGGSEKGTFSTPANSCTGLETPTIITTAEVSKWKIVKGTPKITPTQTALTPGEVEPGTVTVGGNLYGDFVIGAVGASPGPSIPGSGTQSAFSGGDLGASSMATLITTTKAADLGTECTSPKGIAKVGIGNGSTISNG